MTDYVTVRMSREDRERWNRSKTIEQAGPLANYALSHTELVDVAVPAQELRRLVNSRRFRVNGVVTNVREAALRLCDALESRHELKPVVGDPSAAVCTKCDGNIDYITVSLFHQITGKHDQFPSYCMDCMGKALMAMRPLEDRGEIR